MIGLGSSTTLGLGIVMTLDDQVSQSARRVTNSLGNIDNVVSSLERIDNFGQGLADMGFSIARGIGASVKEFARFEDVMNSVKVIAGDQGLTDADFMAMNDQVRKLGEMYGILPEFVAEAQLELAKAGKKPLEIMAMTEATMALGAATDTMVHGANGAAEVLVNVMQAFNATADEANRYAAVITSAANQSTIDVSDFFQSMRYSADIARSLSIPIEEVSTAIATLGNAGLKGSIAGTSLANMYRYLAKAMGQFGLQRQQDALNLLGVSKEQLVNQDGTIKNMEEILSLLRQQYEGMTDIERLAATQGIFGVRGDRAAQPLIRGLMEDNAGNMITAYEEMKRRILNDIDNDVHLTQATDRLDDLMGDWNKMTAAWSNLKIAIGSGIGPLLRPITRAFTRAAYALTDFFNSDFGKMLTKFASLSSIWMIVFGRGISFAARFYTWMITSSGKLSSAFKIGTRTASVLNTSLVQGSTQFLKNITMAANRWVIANKKSGLYTAAGNIQTFGPGGRFGKTVGKGNIFTAIFGMFGKGGLRTYLKVSQWFTRFLPIATRFSSVIKGIGALFGRVLGALFGWPGILTDIVLVMTTGKGILEYFIDAIKIAATWIKETFGQKDPIAPNDQRIAKVYGGGKDNQGILLNTGEFIDNQGNVTQLGAFSKMMKDVGNALNFFGNDAPDWQAYKTAQELLQSRRTQEELRSSRSGQVKTQSQSQIEEFMNSIGKGKNTQINLTINAGDGQTKKQINIDQARSIQSYSIN